MSLPCSLTADSGCRLETTATLAHTKSLRAVQCNPEFQECKFKTSFSVDFGDNNEILKDSKAQAVFAYLTTRWLNACREDTDEVFSGFFFNETVFEDRYFNEGFFDKNIYSDKSSSSLRSMGQANGKCKGKDCPKPVAFSFPNKKGRVCESSELFNDLLIYPTFAGLKGLKSGSLTLDDAHTTYDYLDTEFEEGTIFTTQRHAAQEFLTALDVSDVIHDLEHECTWEGIRCNEDKTISSIFLREQTLLGSIATNVGQLKGIEHIDLSENIIFGNVPSELGSMSNLKTIALNDNELTGHLPDELQGLQNMKLEILKLSGNNITSDMSLYCPLEFTGLDCNIPITAAPTAAPTVTPPNYKIMKVVAASSAVVVIMMIIL